MEWSPFKQFLETPWLFIKNLPGAYVESLKGVPEDIGQGVKGVTTWAGETVGEGVRSIVNPITPILIGVGVILLILAFLQVKK